MLVLLLAILSGCFSLSDREFRSVKASLSQQMPELKLEKAFALSLGSVAMNLVDVATVGIDFNFSAIDDVQIAVYDVENLREARHLNVEQAMMTRDRNLVWQTVVKVREPAEFVWVMVGINENRNEIEAVSILVMERTELILVNVKGDLRSLIEFALKPVEGNKGVIRLTGSGVSAATDSVTAWPA